MANKSGTSPQAVTLPNGGGALQGIGETFSPDLFTGTGNLSIPLDLPAGRNGFGPKLSLDYSTGNGAGPFGLGWIVQLPSITRKTSKGIPRYRDAAPMSDEADTFLLGADELVPISEPAQGVTRFRTRTEGAFARVERIRTATQDAWRIAGRDGLVSLYGSRLGSDAAAVVADTSTPIRIFAWKIVETTDPFGNRIEYRYRRDQSSGGPDTGDQLYLEEVRYIDFASGTETQFLVSVRFVYEQRPDDFFECRAGFEVHTRLRCRRIEIRTHAGQDRLFRSYELDYVDARVGAGDLPAEHLPANRISLLSQIRIVGHDGSQTQELPPLEFGYTAFDPARQSFAPVQAADGAMPPQSLANDDFEMVSLFGNGLPDIVQINGIARFWRNIGGGRFDAAQPLTEIPSGVHLSTPGVQMADMNGDGRADLLVLDRNGYFPQDFKGRWSPQAFVHYETSPSVTFADAELRLLDVDGDGVVDAVRTGIDFELFRNDPRRGWALPEVMPRSEIAGHPDLHFSDPRVKVADMNGDNLQDLVVVDQGRIEYWPYLGHGRWGDPVTMKQSPTFQDAVPVSSGGFDPRRVMLGDLDGDGVDDLVYVEPGRMTFWINRAGRSWSEPLVVDGTPSFPDADAVRLVDLLGTGFQGVLWTADQTGVGGHYHFLELTRGVKPYVLTRIDNHRGAITHIEYTSSTEFYMADQNDPRTRWKAPLPFPIQVVKCIEVIDRLSGGKLSTEYRYHHGYWDGNERELRGFGLVDQLDTESFDRFNSPDAHPESASVAPIDSSRFSPPTLTRRWFHLGDVGDDDPQSRTEIDYANEYWAGDPSLQPRPAATVSLLQQLAASGRAAALRSLRGSLLRSELYALDGSSRADRPYTVTETQYGIREEDAPSTGSDRLRIFFPHSVSERTTEWERGQEPLTRLIILDDYDAYGQARRRVNLAVPRGRNYQAPAPSGAAYLIAVTETTFAQRDTADRYIVDRVASTTAFEIVNDGSAPVGVQLRQIQDGSATRQLASQTFNYYDGEAFVGLPHRKIGDFGALVRSESLVLTEEILQAAYADDATGGSDVPRYLRPGATTWPDDYPGAFRESMAALAGYTFADGTDHRARGYFAYGVRTEFDFHRQGLPARGLPVRARDAFGRDFTIGHDTPYHLFPAQTTDAAGLTTTARFDYRVLQPSMTTDANDNRRAVRFSPLGLVAATMVMGRDGEQVGDTVEAPSTRLEYDFLAFDRTRDDLHPQPVFVRRMAREHHVTDTDVPMPARQSTIETVEYSDGFGRLLQTRSLGEDIRFGNAVFGGQVLSDDQSSQAGDVIGTRASTAGPSVIVSGWTVYDNKGRVIQQYEPFTGVGWKYDPPADGQMGQKVETFYDPLGRVVRAVSPDGSEQRVVHGAVPDLHIENAVPTPWETYTYDANDLAALSPALHPHVAVPVAHHFTPSSTVIDALGRVVESVMRTRKAPQNPGDPPAPIETVRTRTTYDTQGNILTVTDALERVAWRYVYDLSNRPWRLDNIDGGRRRLVLDAAGREIERRDTKGALVLRTYDDLGRPARVWTRDAVSAPMTLQQRMEYGGALGQPAAEHAAMRARNLLGQLHRHHDGAGLTTFEAFDFKGNVVDKSRRVVADGLLLATFEQAPANGWTVGPVVVDWQPRAQQTLQDREAELLEPAGYRTRTAFDALGRVKLLQLPEDVEGTRRTLRPSYNNSGALERVLLDDDVYVDRIAYDAKGQRAFIALGNGVMTRYAYDARTFRLVRLRSERYTKTNDLSYHPAGEPLQDVGYDHDLVGNVVAIRDRTPASGILNNPDASAAADPLLAQLLSSGNALLRRFTYDPLYRLQSATGRECDVPPANEPWRDEPRCTDLTRARAYRETYHYDMAGNLLRLEHTNAPGGFTREFDVKAPSNRLRQVKAGSDTIAYATDANGNVLSETSSRRFEWNHADQLRSFRIQAGASEPSIYAWYLYDAMNRRVKKLVRTQGGAFKVVHYIDDVYEHSRSGGTGPSTAQSRMQIMDDRQRIAVVRIGSADTDDGGPAVQYHLGDHIGSSAVVVDGEGAAVNAEEYTPYGETSFGSFARKRYRYAGMERDSESGLTYHGARYYSAWTARWTAADPLGMAFDPERPGHATSSYLYGLNNPLKFVDPDGTDEDDAIKIKPKIKVIGGALVEEKVRDGSGNEAGHVNMGEGNIKINPVDVAIEGNLSVLDIEAAPKVSENVAIVATAKVGKGKLAVGKSGVEVEAVAFETGVGAKVGPVKGKVLFGLGGKAKLKDGKLAFKAMLGVGIEIEVDFGAIVRVFRPSVASNPIKLDVAASQEETTMRSSSVAHEVAPPLPKKETRPKSCARRARVRYSEAFEYLGYPAANAG